MSACLICGKCPCYEHERKTVTESKPGTAGGEAVNDLDLPSFTVGDTQYQPAVFFGKEACGPMDAEHLAALLAALPEDELTGLAESLPDEKRERLVYPKTGALVGEIARHKARADQYEQDWIAAKYDFGVALGKAVNELAACRKELAAERANSERWMLAEAEAVEALAAEREAGRPGIAPRSLLCNRTRKLVCMCGPCVSMREAAASGDAEPPPPEATCPALPERLREILDTLRMFNRAERTTLYVEHANDTELDLFYSNWPDFVHSLRHSAQMSAYTPNSLRWRRMADDLEQWVRDNPDTADGPSPTPESAPDAGIEKCGTCGGSGDVEFKGRRLAGIATCEACRGSGRAPRPETGTEKP